MNNFGDCLSPPLLKYYGFTPIYCQPKDSQIILAGTLLQWTSPDYNGVILGTGSDDLPLSFPHAKVLAVRGKKTLANVDADVLCLGDPGLLMNKVYPEPVNKEFKLGIIPHFVDAKHPVVLAWKERFKEDVLFIDVLRHPKEVIRDIKRCHAIISSSLHGLIIADAFGIPNKRFVIRETMPTYFYDYKFDDYYSSLDMQIPPMEVNGQEMMDQLMEGVQTNTPKVQELQDNLDRVFKNLKAYL